MEFSRFLDYLGLTGFVSLFKGRVASRDTVSSQAMAGYDTLMTDYAREVRLPVVRDGALFYKVTSIASMGILSASDLDSAERDIIAIRDQLIADGVLSWQRPSVLPFPVNAYPGRGVYVNGMSMVHDTRYLDPLRFFEWPQRLAGLIANSHVCAYEPRRFPEKWPRPVGIRPLYVTPKFFSNAEFPDERLIELMGRMADALSRYFTASNVNMRRNPLSLSFFGPVEYWGDSVLPQDSRVQALKQQRGAPGFFPYWTRLTRYMLVMPPPGADPAGQQLRIDCAPGSPQRDSIRQRLKVGAPGHGERQGDHLAWIVADGAMEFARLMQVASAAVEIGALRSGKPQSRLVHIHAATLCDVTLRRLGYDQLQLPQGSNLFTYLNALDEEKRWRERKRDQNALSVLGLAGVDNGGNDRVNGGSSASTEAALASVTPLLPVIMWAVKGVIALVAWLTSDTEVPRPELNALHDAAGNCFLGVDARGAILEGPLVRQR